VRDDGEQDRHIVLKDTVPHSISSASRAVVVQPQLRLLEPQLRFDSSLEEYDLLEDKALLVSSGIKKLSDLLHVDEDIIRNSQLNPVSKAKLTKLVADQMQRVNHQPSFESLAYAIAQRDIRVRQQCAEGDQQNADKRSEPQEADKKRIKVDAGEAKYVLSIPACCSVGQACAFAESRMGSSRLGARRIRTFALPDGCELDADDRIVEVVSEMVRDSEMLRAVFFEAQTDPSSFQDKSGDRRAQEQAPAAASNAPSCDTSLSLRHPRQMAEAGGSNGVGKASDVDTKTCAQCAETLPFTVFSKTQKKCKTSCAQNSKRQRAEKKKKKNSEGVAAMYAGTNSEKSAQYCRYVARILAH